MSSIPDVVVNGDIEEGAATANSKGISFDVELEPPKRVGRTPRSRNREKGAKLTEATLEEKLRLAEERRKVSKHEARVGESREMESESERMSGLRVRKMEGLTIRVRKLAGI